MDCPICHGAGYHLTDDGGAVLCEHCGGTGEVEPKEEPPVRTPPDGKRFKQQVRAAANRRRERIGRMH